MMRIVKRKWTVEKELLSKIEWENDLVKYTKIILPLKIPKKTSIFLYS